MSAVVTWDDLKTYFKGDVWKELDFSDGRFRGRTRNFTVEIEPEDVLFEYSVSAVDDPSDSEEGVSDDPVAEVAKFLGRDLPGGEFFEQRASDPDGVSRVLRKVSSDLSWPFVARGAVLASLRRAAVLPSLRDVLPSLRTAVLRLAGRADDAFDELESKLRSKGWDVERKDTSSGAPELVVDVSGLYEARISVDSIRYAYVFQFRDHPDLTESGTTDDPIREFQAYYRSGEIEEAEKSFEEHRSPTEPSPESVRETVPAREQDSDVRDRGTVPARKPA